MAKWIGERRALAHFCMMGCQLISVQGNIKTLV